jgi:hypothetical protein
MTTTTKILLLPVTLPMVVLVGLRCLIGGLCWFISCWRWPLDVLAVFGSWLLLLLFLFASAFISRGQTLPEVHNALVAQLTAQGLPVSNAPYVAPSESLSTPLPTSPSQAYSPQPPRLSKEDGLLYVRWDGKPRRIYYVQARNLTSQAWKTVSPQFPAPSRTGYPFLTNGASKYYRIQEGERSGTNFVFKSLATLTNL